MNESFWFTPKVKQVQWGSQKYESQRRSNRQSGQLFEIGSEYLTNLERCHSKAVEFSD
jgi:hypothetical protein